MMINCVLWPRIHHMEPGKAAGQVYRRHDAFGRGGVPLSRGRPPCLAASMPTHSSNTSTLENQLIGEMREALARHECTLKAYERATWTDTP